MATPAVPSRRSIVISIAWDIILNATVPLACYLLVKRFVSPSELTALIFAALFPLLKSAYDLIRHHDLSPIAVVVVLLGIVTSILALFFGGDPRILLIRESPTQGLFSAQHLIRVQVEPPRSAAPSGLHESRAVFFARPIVSNSATTRQREHRLSVALNSVHRG